MSIMSSIDFDLANMMSATELLSCLQEIGWDIFSPESEVTYLPVNDEDNYNWQFEKISRAELHKIIEEKEAHKEIIGIALYWRESEVGVNMLVWPEGKYSFLINISRRCLYNDKACFDTDLNWYRDNIVGGLQKRGIQITGYTFSEVR